MQAHFEARTAAQRYEQAAEMQKNAKAAVNRFETELTQGKVKAADAKLMAQLNHVSPRLPADHVRLVADTRPKPFCASVSLISYQSYTRRYVPFLLGIRCSTGGGSAKTSGSRNPQRQNTSFP